MHTQIMNILEIESEIRKKNNMLSSRITIELKRLEKLMHFRSFKDIL